MIDRYLRQEDYTHNPRRILHNRLGEGSKPTDMSILKPRGASLEKISRNRLTFGELKTATCPFATVLLTLFLSRISRQKTAFVQCRTKVLIKVNERTRNSQTDRTCLTAQPASIHLRPDTKLLRCFCCFKRLLNNHSKGFAREIYLNLLTVDDNIFTPRLKPHPSNGPLAATCRVICIFFRFGFFNHDFALNLT
jgi:hypothetical protein